MADISLNEPIGLAAIFIALLLGGVLKGATGAGMPVIAVPVIAAFYDVRIAVIVLVIPNFLINAWQIYKYSEHNLVPAFTRNFALSGVVGAGLGTFALAWMPVTLLNLLMAAIIFAYIALRIARPAFHLPMETAQKLAWIGGGGGGVLQGALGISAPIAVTFLNAAKLARPAFILTASVFFATMCLIQMPLQIAYGLMTWNLAILGVLALVPMFSGLPIGEWIGKRMSPIVFDRVILVFLTILALKQIIAFFS